MRNIKITALLLAVLMVVSAFAGCGSSDLEDKVSANADAIAGIEQSIKDIADSIAKEEGSSELDDIKADVEANKQSVADILAAIESLKDAVAGATGENEDVKTAISQAGAKIDALKGDFEDNKEHYTTEAVAAIREIFGDAQASISNCATVEAVAAILTAMETELAKYARVDDALYAYVVALKGNITAASEEKVEEAMAALEDAKDFYEDNMEALEEYGEDGDIDLVAEIEELDYLQNSTNSAKLETLPDVTAAAKQLVKDIDAAAEEYDAEDLYDLLSAYKTWSKAAKKLSAENVALVTNYDKLTAALEDAQNVVVAINEFSKSIWHSESLIDGTDAGIFYDYNKLVDGVVALEIEAGSQGLYAIVLDDELVKTAAIYKAIDARLAEFKAEYELSDEAFEYVIAEATGDEYLLEKYEADKAIAAAFAAEYDKLAKGVFTSIKAMNSKKVGAANALELVNTYKQNAKDINAWAKALLDAYKAEYAKVEDASDARSYDADAYEDLVEANFNVMVIEAKLCVYNATDKTYAAYGLGFDTAAVLEDGDGEPILDDEGNTIKINEYYYALYDFSKNADTDKFLTKTFPAANGAAELINGRIKALPENQQISIVGLVTSIGGYVKLNDAGDKLVAIVPEDEADFGVVIDTIAEFVDAYGDLGLAGMIDTAAYEAKLAAVEKIIDKADAAIKALMSAYKALLGNKANVVVTMDNVNDIKALEMLLIEWTKTGRTDMVKATVSNTTISGVKEYKLAGILDAYLDGADVADFYAAILDATDYSATEKDVKNTGAIIRLIQQAKALEKEAAYVESAYKMIKKLNDATSGKAFAYATLSDGVSVVNTLQTATTSITPADVAHLYGVYDVQYNQKTSNGTTTYQAYVKAISFNATKGFYEATVYGNAYKSSTTEAYRNALEVVQGRQILVGDIDVDEGAEGFYNAIFVDLVDDIKTTDSEELCATGNLFAQKNNKDVVIPAFALPMIATYLEAKFEINNMGKAYEAIETAKNGWGTPTSNYGFEWIKAMTVTQLRTDADARLSSASLTAIGNTIDLTELTVAVNAALEAAEDFDKNIQFGHADATWLSKTYDLNVVDFAKGGYTEGTAQTALYAAHGINLSKLAVDVISIYVAD